VSAHPKSIEEKENANNDPMHRNNQYVSELWVCWWFIYLLSVIGW
jgi:hypothetical protein